MLALRRVVGALMALGLIGLVLPGLPELLEEESAHSCVCPLDAAGHCECVTCNLLEVHGPRVAHSRPTGPALSGCTTRQGRAVARFDFEPVTLADTSAQVYWICSPEAPSARGDSAPLDPPRERLERPPRQRG